MLRLIAPPDAFWGSKVVSLREESGIVKVDSDGSPGVLRHNLEQIWKALVEI